MIHGGFIFFIITSAISYVFSPPSSLSDVLELRWFLGFYASILLGILWGYFRLSIKIYSASIICLFLILALYHRNMWGDFVIKPDLRFQGTYENPNHLGLVLTILLAFFLGSQGIAKKTIIQFFFYLAALASIGAFILGTYSRTSWIGSMIVALVFVSLYHRRYLTILLTSGIAILSTAILLNLFSLKDRLLFSFNLSQGQSQGQRLSAWNVNFHIFTDAPFFGRGLENISRYYPEYYNRLNIPTTEIVGHAHNQFLEILAGSGAIGFVFFYAFILGLLATFIRAYKNKNPVQKTLGATGILTIVAFISTSFTETPFRLAEFRNFAILFFGLIWGNLFYQHILEQTQSKERKAVHEYP